MHREEHMLHHFKKIHDNVEKCGNAKLKENGLTLAQGHILGLLRHRAGHSATLKEVEKSMKVAQSTTAGMVARLESNGFVETSTDPIDKRIKIVTLTQQGLESTELVKESIQQVESELLATLTEEERAMLMQLLKKVSANC